MKRRDFLGRVTQVIAALGMYDAAWLRLGDRYYQALAQSTQRRLALLVGINQYPSIQPLNGCLTDVELQRELLIHRFGFQEADIISLTEQQATKQQIETAFLEHLVKQAQPGDVVVFHFSGYGRRVELSQESGAGEAGEAGEAGKNSSLLTTHYPLLPPKSPLTFNSLVPIDGVSSPIGVSGANDLLDETLWRLLRSLSTQNITTILDTSFNAPRTVLLGNLRVRSFPEAELGQISAAELAFPQQLQQNLKLQFSIPGVVLSAAGSAQSATEVRWNGFSAGLFTYALTQYLWEATAATTVQVSLSRVAGVVGQLVGHEQQPQISGQKKQFGLPYHLKPEPSTGSANGVVKSVEEDGKTAQLWLAGIPPAALEYYEIGSKLNLIPSPTGAEEQGSRGAGEAGGETLLTTHYSLLTPTTPLQLQVRSRTGLMAKAQVVGESSNSLKVGQLVQEAVRVLSHDIRLAIALAPNLERIERVDATSAFAAIRYVSLVTSGEQLADYVFGRAPEEKPETLASLLDGSPSNRYGLFSLDQSTVPNTIGESGEVVKVAVQRLAPKLQTLLAAKLWRLTTNEGSSQLNVKAALEIINSPGRVLVLRETLRSQQEKWSAGSKPLFPTSSPDSIPVPIGSRIQYRVRNDSDRPVYLLLLGLDSSKSAIALYSTQPVSAANGANAKPMLQDVAIAPGETLIVPQTTVDFEWVIRKPTGLAEHQLIFSSASFSQSLATMAAAMGDVREQRYTGTLLKPLEVVQAMLQDLHNTSIRASDGVTSNTESASTADNNYVLDVNHWASLSFVYQVV